MVGYRGVKNLIGSDHFPLPRQRAVADNGARCTRRARRAGDIPPGGSRTHDLGLGMTLLYPIELQGVTPVRESELLSACNTEQPLPAKEFSWLD